MAIKIPSLASAIRVPITIPTLPGVPTLPGLPGAPLICGANEALGKLEAVRTQILGLLADKKEALAMLAEKAGVAKSTIDQLKQIEQTVYSLQNDVNGLLNNPTPAQISAFLNRWGTKLPSAELQSLISKISKFTSGQATLNLCVDIPNFKIKGLDGVLEKDALTTFVPGLNPPNPVALVPTVVDNTKKVSTGDSGVVIGDVDAQMTTKVFDAYRSQVGRPIVNKLVDLANAIRDLKKTKDGKSITKKTEKYGKKGSELAAQGLLTPSEVNMLGQIQNAVKARESFLSSSAEIPNYFDTYIGIVGAGGPQTGTKDGGVLLKKWQKELSENTQVASYYNTATSIVDSNAGLIVEWSAYILNKPKGS